MGELIMKKSFASLGFSAVFLAIAGLGLGLNVHAGQKHQAREKPPVAAKASTESADADLMAALGDEFVGNCNSVGHSCGKAWHDLGTVIEKEKF